MPEVAGGFGAPTLAEASVGATRKRDGKKVGYVSAHCSGGRLQVEGTLTLHQRRPLPDDPHLAVSHPRLRRAALLFFIAAGGAGRDRGRRPGRSRQPRPPRRRRLQAADPPPPPVRPDRLRRPPRHRRQRRRQALAAAPGADRLRPRRPPQRRRAADLRAGIDRRREHARKRGQICRGAIVGTGNVEALITLPTAERCRRARR